MIDTKKYSLIFKIAICILFVAVFSNIFLLFAHNMWKSAEDFFFTLTVLAVLAFAVFFIRFVLRKLDKKIVKFKENATKSRKLVYDILFYLLSVFAGALIGLYVYTVPESRTTIFVYLFVCFWISFFLWLFRQIALRWMFMFLFMFSSFEGFFYIRDYTEHNEGERLLQEHYRNKAEEIKDRMNERYE